MAKRMNHLLPALATCALALIAGAPGAAMADVYYVDGASASCSDSADGSAARPYCTISAALARHHAAGTTLRVQPAVYREQVTVPASGLAGAPLEVRADASPGTPVVIDGSDDLSAGSNWRRFSGHVFLASGVTWNPVQVFLDGARIPRSSAKPGSLPNRTYTWVSGQGLYLNPGDNDPGAHAIEVGRRPYGIYVSGRSWVVLDGFTVRHAEDRGIQLTNAAHDVEVTNNTIRLSGRFGLQVKGGRAIHIAGNTVSDNADHGISLIAGTNGCLIERNECFRNAYPGGRSANGIYLFGAPRNRIRENRLHHNQDTGLQIQSFSDSNVCIQNLSWSNGDHGYDHLRASGTLHVGDVAWGNYKDGFSIEGNAVGQTLMNCIAVENGLTTGEFDLWVDDSSSVSFTSDDNIFWNSTPQPPVKYRTVVYASVPAYASASGQDSRTAQLDPRFANPAGGDFHLLPGSPAIDAANTSSSEWPALDADGRPRTDDPSVPNRGLGPVAYADRGAFEFLPAQAALLPTPSGDPSLSNPSLHPGAPRSAATPGTAGSEASPGPGAPAGARPVLEPNPLRDGSVLAFVLSRSGPTSVRLYGVDGRRVRTILADQDLAAGSHALRVEPRDDDGRRLPAGVYLCELVAPEGRSAIRIVVVR